MELTALTSGRHLREVLCSGRKHHRVGRRADEAFRIYQGPGDCAGTADSLLRLAGMATALGNYQLARQHYQEALTLANETGDPSHECSSLGGFGTVASAVGNHAEARQWFEESLVIGSKLGRGQFIHTLIGLAHATCAPGEVQRPKDCFCQVLETAMKVDRTLEALHALVGLAHLLSREGEPERAVEPLALALHHPGTRQATTDRAPDLLAELVSELPRGVCADVWGRDQARELKEVAAEILEGRDG